MEFSVPSKTLSLLRQQLVEQMRQRSNAPSSWFPELNSLQNNISDSEKALQARNDKVLGH